MNRLHPSAGGHSLTGLNPIATLPRAAAHACANFTQRDPMTFIATSSCLVDPSFEDLGSTMLLPFSASASVAVLAASDEDDDFVFDDDDEDEDEDEDEDKA